MTKDGQFSCREIFSYLSDGKYPSDLSKADKLALLKSAKFYEAKGSCLYYSGRGENVHIVLINLELNHAFLLHVCATINDSDGSTRVRLVVEDAEQWRRIVSVTHEDGHFGVKRTNDTKASKYYWLFSSWMLSNMQVNFPLIYM